jgi:hypothetical protein
VLDEAYTSTIFAQHDIAQGADHKISVCRNNNVPGRLWMLNQETYAITSFALENADIDRTPGRSTCPTE